MNYIISSLINFLNRINKFIWKIIIFLSNFIKINDNSNFKELPANERYRRFKVDEPPLIEKSSNLNTKDCYICPKTGVILPYTGRIDRNGYKYYSDKENCKGCPHQKECCNKKGYRIITRLICEEINEKARERRLSKRGKEMYKLRKEKVERSFADSKNNHAYRYAMYRGVEKNQNYTWLICAAQNMKNIALKLTNVMG